MKDSTANLQRQADGSLPDYAWPGCYPLYYVVSDPDDGMGGTYPSLVCPNCARQIEEDREDPSRVVKADANWEDEDMTCEYCEGKIECAYPSDKES